MSAPPSAQSTQPPVHPTSAATAIQRRGRLRVWLVGGAIAALLLTVVVALLWVRTTRYAAHIQYDVTADYRFDYDPRYGQRTPVQVDAHALQWPAIEGDWDAAFVELELSSSAVGAWVDPQLTIRLGDNVVHQYFERGARGKRWLNVTQLLQRKPAAGASVELRGTHLSWRSGTTTLHLLRAPSTTAAAGPLLVLAPHPDDAEIAAFGLYSGQPAWVITVTLGESGNDLYRELLHDVVGHDPKASFAEKARVRLWDSLTIPQLGDVPAERVANLGYFDGTLKAMWQTPERAVQSLTLGTEEIGAYRRLPLDATRISGTEAYTAPQHATWRNLVEDLRRLIVAIRPGTVVLPHPGLDGHSDHQFATVAFVEALRQTDVTDGRMLLYTNHCTGSELFPFGPSEGTVSIPPALSPRAYFQSVMSHPLNRQQQSRKAIALHAEHDLQIEPLGPAPSFRRVVRKSLEAPFQHWVDVDLSYMRRAVRPNELFFVVGFDQATAMIDAFLREQPSAAPAAKARHAPSP